MMKFFFKKALKWLAFLLLTVSFFSLPVFLHRQDEKNDFLQRRIEPQPADSQATSSLLYFEFEPGSLREKILGDSTALRMLTASDTSEKHVFLYVNGEKQDMAVVSDTMRIEFARVYLRPGANEIIAVLQNPVGETLAVRKARIFSLKKM